MLDLGCGKGAVSVKIAQSLQYKCHGIDAISEFVSFAAAIADEYQVANLCRFEQGDIREYLQSLGEYDIIILGAIGQVMGNYYQTLTQLAPHLSSNGIIIVDDGFVGDESGFVHPQVLMKIEMLRQIGEAGMVLVDEVMPGETTVEGYDEEYIWLSKRCDELGSKQVKRKNDI